MNVFSLPLATAGSGTSTGIRKVRKCVYIYKHIYFQVDCPNSALSTRRGVLHIYITYMYNTNNTIQYNTMKNTVKYNTIQIININLIFSKMLREFVSCKAASTGR